MIEPPFDDLTDPIRLADWLELYALSSPDRDASRGNLESILRRASLSELDEQDRIELKTLEVFDELDQRAQFSQESYPFDVDYAGVVTLRSENWEEHPAYILCLCLSYLPLRETRIGPKLFEQVSCLAAKGYLEGDVVGFGPPRTELPTSFSDAVTELCTRLGEGVQYLAQLSHHRQDDTLDLVAWKEFGDGRPSKLLMFGQCGAGRNWSDKLGELQPNVFWDQWMQRSLVSPDPVKSFFTPYRVEPDRWVFYARKAGILFDRCRIAFWAHREEADYRPTLEWIKSFLSQVAQ